MARQARAPHVEAALAQHLSALAAPTRQPAAAPPQRSPVAAQGKIGASLPARPPAGAREPRWGVLQRSEASSSASSGSGASSSGSGASSSCSDASSLKSSGMSTDKVKKWKELVEAGTKAGEGHTKSTKCDDIAARVQHNGMFSKETTCAVAVLKSVSKDGQSIYIVAACKDYQGKGREKNQLILSTLEYEFKVKDFKGSYTVGVAPCPEGYHAEMAIAKHLGDVKGFEFGASIGCCPLCMAYLSSKGATFGMAGSEPKERWVHPTEGYELANPAKGYADLLLS
jgi:hypothetical protein